MRLSGAKWCAVAAMFGLWGAVSTVHAQVKQINPVLYSDKIYTESGTTQSLPVITFDNNINPISPANPFGGALSQDALNIVRAQAVAIQQVQAAILYLRSHRWQIMQGKDKFYNKIFGDFYVKGNPFDSDNPLDKRYNRTVKVPRTRIIYTPTTIVPTTGEYQRTITTNNNNNGGGSGNTSTTVSFALPGRVQAAPALDAIYVALGYTFVLDPPYTVFVPSTINVVDRLGNPIYDDAYNTAHYDRILDTFVQIQSALNNDTNYQWGAIEGAGNTADPNLTTYAGVNGLTIGDANYGAGTQTLDPSISRGFMQWGDSTSFSPEHLDQLANNPNNPLLWYLDNNLNANADFSETFFRERLDAYGTLGTLADPLTGTAGVANEMFVGGAFLDELRRGGGLFDTNPNSLFQPTELNQYQMLIMSFAQMLGNGTEPGLTEMFGNSPYFLQSMDSSAFARFASLLGEVGDGTLLVPPGKAGVYSDTFSPIVP